MSSPARASGLRPSRPSPEMAMLEPSSNSSVAPGRDGADAGTGRSWAVTPAVGRTGSAGEAGVETAIGAAVGAPGSAAGTRLGGNQSSPLASAPPGVMTPPLKRGPGVNAVAPAPVASEGSGAAAAK